jgi:DNA gyrase inhibitor GyrI
MNIKNVEVKQLPKLYTAARSHIGPYNEIGVAYEILANWAAQKGLHQATRLAIYHDDPYKVPATQLRSDACLVVDTETVIDGDVRPYKVSGGKYLVINAELTMSECIWEKAYQVLKEKGLQSDARDHYELYLTKPTADAMFLIDICIPVR